VVVEEKCEYCPRVHNRVAKTKRAERGSLSA
jgi:hypothetical protein